MSIRVVARIRPQQQHELAKDTVIEAASKDGDSGPLNVVKLENPKNPTESFTFDFSSVYRITMRRNSSYLTMKLHRASNICSMDSISPSSHTDRRGLAKHTLCAAARAWQTEAASLACYLAYIGDPAR